MIPYHPVYPNPGRKTAQSARSDTHAAEWTTEAARAATAALPRLDTPPPSRCCDALPPRARRLRLGRRAGADRRRARRPPLALAAQAEAAEKNAKAGARATKGALEKAKQAAAALRRRVAA